MFEAQAISWRWPGAAQPTLKDIGLSVSPGEIVGLLGPSGCGKTTLARILAGYLQPASGRILLDGQTVDPHGIRPVQLVFQHAELALNPRLRTGVSIREGWEPDEATLSRFGIRHEWLQRYPHELSGGELQRIAIVRALIPTLRVLIVDELTAMHDAITQAQIWRALIDTLQPRKVGMLAISHDRALLHALEARTSTLTNAVLAPN